ncbi:MAG: SpoVA/SpoVAEb family sporulation membrane protein, partial [Clostridiales bacterium]
MSGKPQPPVWYGNIIKKRTPPPPVLRNCVVAFLVGGLLCALAQTAHFLLVHYEAMAEQQASTIVMIFVVALAALFTGLNLYDKGGQWSGAGLAVPISGFANSVAAAMLEHKTEGFVLGSGCNSFKLAGAVVVF